MLALEHQNPNCTRTSVVSLRVQQGPKTMENYEKGETVEVDTQTHLACRDDAVHMKVSNGSKIRNLMGFAMKKIKDPNILQITWNGAGNAIPKVISCAEITKRNVKGLHQVTKASYKRVEEYWEPKLEGLERLKVNKDIPVINILLSKEPLDENEPGYQAPGSFDAFWKKSMREEAKSGRKKSKAMLAGPTEESGHDPPSMTRKRRKKGETDKLNISDNKGRGKSGEKKRADTSNQKQEAVKRKKDRKSVAGEGSSEDKRTDGPKDTGKQGSEDKQDRTEKQKQRKETKTREKTGANVTSTQEMDTT